MQELQSQSQGSEDVSTQEMKEGAVTALGAGCTRDQPTLGLDSSSPISETGFDGHEVCGGINYTNQKLNYQVECRESREASVAWA